MTHPGRPVHRDEIELALEDSGLQKWQREWVLHRLDSVEGLEQSVDLWHKRYMDASEPTQGFTILLRCERINQDEAGYTATFSGKPNTHGNHLTLPVDNTTAARLTVGAEYLAQVPLPIPGSNPGR